MSRLHNEPLRGINLASWLTSFSDTTIIQASTFGITADIIVFGYPIFLILWYLRDGWTHHTTHTTDKKNQALTIFMSVLCSICITIIIQLFSTKQRPIRTNVHTTYTESILHDFLPKASFPSDHATVSFAFAFACLALGYLSHHKALKIWGYLRFLGAIITSISRIVIHLHRPTDIIGGFLSGLGGTLLIIVLHNQLSTTIYPYLHTTWTRCVYWIQNKFVQRK